MEARCESTDDYEESNWVRGATQTVTKALQDAATWPQTNPYGTDAIPVNGSSGVIASPAGGTGSAEYVARPETVCTVDASGNVSGVAAGTCYVKFRWSGDDDYEPSAYSPEVSVTVAN